MSVYSLYMTSKYISSNKKYIMYSNNLGKRNELEIGI